jgi:hypothetical protein
MINIDADYETFSNQNLLIYLILNVIDHMEFLFILSVLFHGEFNEFIVVLLITVILLMRGCDELIINKHR